VCWTVFRSLITVFGLWSLLTATAAAQVPSSWINRQLTRREAAAMAYDTVRQRAVLFGGNTGAGSTTGLFSSDTWEWDGGHWSLRTPVTSPPERAYHAMAYDAARQRVVLFGGWNARRVPLSDTWDRRDWRQVLVAQSPSARWEHRMVTDPVRRRIVLFGGGGTGPSPGLFRVDRTSARPPIGSGSSPCRARAA